MTLVLFGFALAALAVAAGRWRWGLLLCPLVGFAQDPARKLLPGRPVALVVVVAGVLAVVLASALARGQARWLRTALAGYRELRLPLALFAALVVVQALRTQLVYGNRTVAAIGLLAYLSPLGAVAAYYLLARDARDARRFLAVYVAGAAVAGLSVVLHFLGVSHRLFESIALDTVYGVGVRVQMYCGLYRGSELAAFHSATAACLALAWASGKRRAKTLVPAGLLVGLLLVAVVVSGRRKMLAQLGLFVVAFLFLEARARGRRGRVVTILTTLGLAGGLLWLLAIGEETGSRVQPYLVRGRSVVGEAFERLTAMTVDAFSGVLANVGPLGAGAGVASQGTQYVGSGGPVIWSNAEGGLGRVLAELGLPGLALLAALGWASLAALRRAARCAARIDSPDAHLVFGAAAIVASNAVVFVSAQQLYGDPFVLVVLGALFGLALGFPPATAFALRARAAAAPADGPRASRQAPLRPLAPPAEAGR